MGKNDNREERGGTRRDFLKLAATGAAVVTLAAPQAAEALEFDFETFFQKHFRKMSDEELEALIQRLERKYEKKYGKEFNVKATGPIDDVLFGYGLDVSRCIGCRRCVHACVEENNQSRDPEIQWIRVLEFEREAVVGGVNLEEGDPYFENPVQPAPGKMYLPVACMHCENSPCTNVCPTGATWEEPDGIVAIDYDWCIGCRYCIAACPYGARHFNWSEPTLSAEDINPDIHIIGNKPRTKGVVEKCHWCMQRVRDGRYPACLEACPVGARKFGNLLDPNSEIRYVMENKRTFVLKSELGTKPKFFYFF
jgi:molybdopterin-containing oxidoreductase family iron-sulfur binding subunit